MAVSKIIFLASLCSVALGLSEDFLPVAEESHETILGSGQGPIQCYYVLPQISENLPLGATKVWCTNSQGCQKTQTRTVVRHHDGTRTETVRWSWGCRQWNPLLPTMECDDVYEKSYGSVLSGNEVSTTYSRSCACCPDSCNNADMNCVCNEEPTFDKHCAYADISSVSVPPNPRLPGSSILVNCTSTMPCSKSSLYDSTGYRYLWGCMSYPPVGCDNGYMIETTLSKIKSCTCCNSKCNGFAMDWLTLDSLACDAPSLSSATTFAVALAMLQLVWHQ